MGLLSKEGIAIEHIGNYGQTALTVAVNQDHHDCALLLLQQGCDILVLDSDGITVMHRIAVSRSTRMLNLLMSFDVADGPSRGSGHRPSKHEARSSACDRGVYG